MDKPLRIAEETYVLPFTFPVPGLGLLQVNPMVIRAEQPVLVDTGPPVFREQYLEAAFSLVDPKAVRWVFLSHDDRDHSGNLMQVLDLCPNARLATTFIGVGRMGEEWQLPLPRVVLVNDGESFDAGDRTLTAIRPPLFDAPGTRGLWDSTTGVYYSVDSFGAFIPAQCEQMADVPEDAYQRGFAIFNRINHPWHEVSDGDRLAAQVDRVRRLDARAIVSYHGPTAHHRSAQLCDALVATAAMEPMPLPTQADLEAMLAAGGHAAEPAAVG
ncbi:MAG TPA: MBL fold metallo-hydrolase [Candidatus Dormibacteraeota bacterium]|nr:MBL fold metallo-hydrolase [Candidatus Dormibacteraeota bacterium]